jgi:putative transposase
MPSAPSEAVLSLESVAAQCGHNNNADVVGAINILERGHRLLACGGDLEARGPMKQEPAEMVA